LEMEPECPAIHTAGRGTQPRPEKGPILDAGGRKAGKKEIGKREKHPLFWVLSKEYVSSRAAIGPRCGNRPEGGKVLGSSKIEAICLRTTKRRGSRERQRGSPELLALTTGRVAILNGSLKPIAAASKGAKEYSRGVD